MSSDELDEAFDALMEIVTAVSPLEDSIYLKVYPTDSFVKIGSVDANKLLQTNQFDGYRMKASGIVYLCLKGKE